MSAHYYFYYYSYYYYCFTFFKKPASSRLILRADTALPERMKYENGSNELICWILNTSKSCKNYEVERNKVTNNFMETLKISRYSEGFRKQTTISAIRGVRRMEEREEKGIRNVFRLQTVTGTKLRLRPTQAGSKRGSWIVTRMKL